jgi:hypothetical protein
MVDVATGATVANNNAVGIIVPPSLTKDKGAYVGALVAFEGACVGAFADGAGQLHDDDDVKSSVGKLGH